MSDCSQTSGIVIGISSVVVLFVSELLPFLPIQQNGILHALVSVLRNQLPTRPTTTTTEESSTPPVTSTV